MLVEVEDSRAIKVSGDPDHPPTQGFPCTKVARYLRERLGYAKGWRPELSGVCGGEGKRSRSVGRMFETPTRLPSVVSSPIATSPST